MPKDVFYRKHPRATLLLPLAGAVLLLGAFWFFTTRHPGLNDPELTTPVLAVRTIAPRSLFFTPAARSYLLSTHPEWLAPGDATDQSDRSRQFADCLQNPDYWRQIDRQYRFDTLLLTGEPNQFRPLLKHLLESRDWVLAYLDHTSIVFRLAPAIPWTEHDLDAVRQRFAGRSAAERVEFLVQASNRLLNAGQTALAGKYADDALALDSESAAAWTQHAAFYGMSGKWPEALTEADHALRIEAAFQPALAMKAQALLAMNRPSDAYDLSRRLVELNPGDPFLLFQHARISHAAHAYASEAEVLKTLITMADNAHQSACGYHIYLAQAYAAQGDATPSIDEFQKALADPAITSEQRAYAHESIDRIKSKIGL